MSAAHSVSLGLLVTSASLCLSCGGPGDPDAGLSDASADAARPDAPTEPDSTVTETGDRGAVLRVAERAHLRLPTLQGDVQVLFTEGDVPHIYASNDRDLRVVEGFLIARERFGQLELYRRYGLGELSALFGDVALGIDVSNRALGRTGFADRILTLLTPEQEDALDAFAEGVNAYIESVGNGVSPAPSEHTTLRPIIAPRARSVAEIMRPMTRRDLAGIAASIVYFFGFDDVDLRTSAALADIEQRFDGDPFETLRRDGVLRDIIGRIDPVHPITSVECSAPPCFGISPRDGRTARAPRFLPLERDMMRRLVHQLDHFAALRGGVGADIGSNAWAVSGTETTNGASLLSGDGHLPLQTAPLFYQAGFDTRLFGDDTNGLRSVGMLVPGIVPMGPGTNGNIAWSQTYQEADVVDWYREEIVLGTDGSVAGTRFRGETRDIVRRPESYTIASVPFFNSVGRTLELARFETFDGRHIVSIEGTPSTAGADPRTVYVGGQYLIPGDANSDGRIEAISMDYTVFDGSNMLTFLFGLERARSVQEAHDATRSNVGYTQNLIFADRAGGLLYTAYNATPCRSALRPPGMSTGWAPLGNPRFVLDGTQFGGFEVRFDAQGFPVESSDASACLIPRASWPEELNPTRGFVLSANNDLGGTSLDGTLDNDVNYVGGPWDPGYRANTIHARLSSLTATNSASADEMQRLQAERHSQLGLEYVPALRAAVEHARRLRTAGPTNDDETRLAGLYGAQAAAIDEALMRLDAWIGRGANAASGVETFYDQNASTEAPDAVATMIFNEWFRRFTARVLGDENIRDIIVPSERQRTWNTLHRIVAFRGDTPEARRLASFNPSTLESIFFDTRGTTQVERSDEQFVGALADALTALTSASSGPGLGGFGTADMSQWLWGLRHQVRLESVLKVYAGELMGLDLLTGPFAIGTSRLPLAPMLPATDPRSMLQWFPRPGDHGAVDASPHSFDVAADYTYAYGPSMRMVIELGQSGPTIRNILPGGQSGLVDSPHFADQIGRWLANETLTIPYAPADVARESTAREWFGPNIQ